MTTRGAGVLVFQGETLDLVVPDNGGSLVVSLLNVLSGDWTFSGA